MSKPKFTSHTQLTGRVAEYFSYIEGEYQLNENTGDSPAGQAKIIQKTCIREPEPPTIAGLAFFLGFYSRQAFEDYLRNGKFSSALQQGLLRIEAVYEKKLHNHQSATGAIFILKTLGRNEKINVQEEDKTPKNLKIEVEVKGPILANSELMVALD